MNAIKGLVLAAKLNESIILHHLGIEIIVTVIDCENGKVRLLFTAPKEVLILREKLITEMEKCQS